MSRNLSIMHNCTVNYKYFKPIFFYGSIIDSPDTNDAGDVLSELDVLEIQCLQVPIYDTILKIQLGPLLDIYTRCLSLLLSPTTEAKGVLLLQLVAKIFLQKPLRSGRLHRKRKQNNFRDKVTKWKLGLFGELWANCKAIEQYRQQQIQRHTHNNNNNNINRGINNNINPATHTTSNRTNSSNNSASQLHQQNIKYAIKLANKGFLRKSMQALNSQGVAPLNAHTHALFRSKLVPGQPVSELSGVYDKLVCDVALVDQLIHRLNSSSKGGPDMLHNAMLV